MIRGKRSPKKKKWSWEDLSRALHSSTAQCVYIFLVGTAVLCLLLMLAVTPQRYNLKVGDIAPNTITASKDVVDEISTTRQQQCIAAFRFLPGTCIKSAADCSECFDRPSVIFDLIRHSGN